MASIFPSILSSAPRSRLPALALALTLVCSFAQSSWAQQVVSNTNDSGPGSLRNAIEQANANPGTTISIVATGNIDLLSSLPPITADMAIIGPGASDLTIDGGGANRVFMVLSGTVSVSNLSVSNGLAQGGAGSAGSSSGNSGGGGGGLGAGGALFINSGASVTLHNVPLTGNAAAGGSGGALAAAEFGSGGGGGGGLGGNGGAGGSNSMIATGGGGGGGINLGGGQTGAGGVGGIGGSNANGTNGAPYSGGGGGGGTNGNPGAGADGAGNGAAGGANSSGGGGGGGIGGQNAATISGGAGGFGGGGGGGGLNVGTFQSGNGGNGGYGGGGGGGGGVPYFGTPGNGGNGGFGAGGGGGHTSLGATAGAGGQFAGAGSEAGGGGGAGLGGAVFVVQGGTLIVEGTTVSGGSVAGGSGSTAQQNGQAAGSGLFLDNVNLSFQGSSNAVFDDTIGGSGGVNQNGSGSTTLNGLNNYSGATNVNAGKLIVNGRITSATNVGAAGTLGGSGTIQQNLMNQGTVAPGNSIGTLSVTGNYTQTPSANLQIEINDQGQGDRLAVQGAATIQGGAVNVVAQPGNYSAGTRYTFLTAQAINGRFTSITDDLAFLDAMLGYDAQSAYFTLLNNNVNYAAIAETHNQFALGTYLDQVAPTASAEFATALSQLDTLSAEQARAAYDQLDGNLHGSLGQIGLQNTTLVLYQLNNRLAGGILAAGPDGLADASGFNGASAPVVLLRDDKGPGGFRLISRCCPPEETWSGWTIGYGVGGNVQSSGNVGGVNYGMGGTLVGLERYLSDTTLIGFYGGYVGTGVTSRDGYQSGSVNGGQFGSYFRHADGFNHTTLVGGFEFDGYQTRRRMAFGTLNDMSTANYTGWQGYAYGERGVTFAGPRMALQPYGALQYVYLRQNSFAENGADYLSLSGRGSDTNSLRSFVGGRALFRPYARLSPQLRAAWVHEFLSTTSIVNAHFGPIGGGAFAVQGLSLGRDWALLGGGLTWQLNGNWSLWGNYDAMVNTHQVFHVGSGGVQVVW